MKKEKRVGKYYKLTQEDFINKCKDTQKVPIDFTDFVYITQHEYYDLRCTLHNHKYTQNGQSLIKGLIGCKYCLNTYKSNLVSGNKDTFLEKFMLRYPDSKFDFSNSTYIRANQHMEVVCNHGHTFSVKPNNLMSGHGCPICYKIKKGHLHQKGTDSYIAKFKEVHGEKYDYSLVGEFKNCKQKVDVLCNDHGIFKITPDNHVQGKGCPLCGKSGYQPQNKGMFYILQVTPDVIKFGITGDMKRRLQELNSKSSFDLKLLYCFCFENGYIASQIENEIYKDKSIARYVVSRADMPSGYVETTYLSNISKILEYVSKHTPA